MRVMALASVVFVMVACSAEQRQKLDAGAAVVDAGCDEAKCDLPQTDTVLAAHCPADMIEINGEYCPKDDQKCLKWKNNAYGERCLEWRQPVKCVSKTIHKSYCIDTYEYPNKKGSLPQDWMSWYDAKNACEAIGKRLCTKSEWTMAALGPDLHPYPYGDGFHRDSTACNFDNHIHGVDVMKVSSPDSDGGRALHNLLVPSGSRDRCVSDYGVHDMPGNIDEWVVNESGRPYVSGLVGGHVFGIRCASRPMTDAHGPTFVWYESGTRCCENVKETEPK